MKGKILTGILILMFISPNTSYPCPNIPPNVIITDPSDGALYVEGDDITIEAHAWDDDGHITTVEFYYGTTKLGEDISEPYSYIWTDVSPGSYTLKARAYDNGGAWTDSVPVNIIVGNIWYVDKDANGAGDGQSWEDAYNYLQDALAVAADADEIRIAEGVYRPDQYAAGDTGMRGETFQLKNRVVVKGGYAGFGESNPDERDMVKYETVLSGDIGSEGDDLDNSYHVVTADDPDIDNSTVLDGFTITGGNASGGTYYYGGGLLIRGEEGSKPEPMVVNCVFRNNRANSGGGGIHCRYASPTITKCFFSNNSASSTFGGGLDNFSSDPKVINCIFSGNTAYYGGGMHNYYYSSPRLTNCTFSGNSASSGGGMANFSSSSPIVTNCILWGDAGGEIYNDWNSSTIVNYCDIQGGWLSGEDNINVDPRFVHAENPTGADNVFGTLDDGLYLRPDSPYNCIDMGHERDGDYPDVPDDDITGYARPADGDHSGLAEVDMGAYETVPVWYVKADAEGNNDGTNWTNAREYLQDALVYDAAEGDEIWVAGGTYQPDQGGGKTPEDRTATFGLRNGVSIYGGFAGTEHSRAWRDWTKNETILSGDLLGDDVDVSPEELRTEPTRSENSYHVVTGSGTDATAVLDGFTIAAGNANMTTGGHNNGGGISNNAGSPTLTNCVLTDNSANDAGGGLHNIDSDPNLTNCTVSGNAASSGGGLYNIGSSPTIANCVFCSNYASADGGGIYNSQSFSRLTNCTFSGNNAGNQGGGICNNDPYPEIINCIIWGNTAASEASICNINTYNLDDDPSLVSWWRFNEGEGSIAYDSAGENDGTIYGAQWTTGQIDGALDFDGVDDYVDVGDPVDGSLDFGAADSFSISAWIKTSTDSPIVHKRRCDGIGGHFFEGYDFISLYKKLFFAIEDTSGRSVGIFGNTAVADDQWHHVVAVRDTARDNLYVYLDGSSDATPVTDTTTVTLATSRSFYIARRDVTFSPGSVYYEGTIADVRMYNRSLTEAEVGSLSGFIRYSNIEGCGGSSEWDASFGNDGGGNIDEDPCFADSDNPAGTDDVFGTSDDGLRLKPDSPCIDAADGDAALDTDMCGEERLDIEFIPNAGVGILDYADIGAYEYVNPPGYTNSFETYQGFDGSTIDGIDGWEVEDGSYAHLVEATYKEDNGQGGSNDYSYQRVQIYDNSTISYDTNESCEKTFIRVNCIPSPGSFINIVNGSSLVASIKFEQNGTISVWNSGSYATTTHDYLTIANQCRDFLMYPETYYNDPGYPYSYENTWIEFTIQFDWENHTYDVSWTHYATLPTGAPIYTGAGSHPSHHCYTKVEFKTGSDSTYFELNRISISDTDSEGGVVGPDEEDDAWLIAPVADILNPLKGQCVVAGPMWYDMLGEYVVKCCPTDLDSADPCNWIVVCSGKSVSKDPILLGYWKTEAYYNGDYFLKIEVYDDLRRLYSEGIIKDERTFNGTSKVCKVRYPVIGRAKARTFHYEEHPDFTINWPGTFPFEFKRMYNNGLRARIYPLFFGWTHNHNIRLIEDSQYDWIVDVDEFENEKPAGDENGLGIGRLWLCQPLGGEMFIGYVNTQNPQEVIYEPLDNENHYIIRIVNSVDETIPEAPVFDVTYVYYAPDGMKMTFNKVFTGPRSVPVDEGLVDWIVVAGIDEQADRFGNYLEYTWDVDEMCLQEISNNRTPANLRFTYDFAPFALYGPDIGPQDLCDTITLYEGDTPTDAKVWFIECSLPDFQGKIVYGAAKWASDNGNGGLNEHRWSYYHNTEQEFMLTYIASYPWGDNGRDGDFEEINTYAEHNDDGTLIERTEVCQHSGSGAHQAWGVPYPSIKQYDYEYDNKGNLITTVQVKCGHQNPPIFLREEVVVTNPDGALLSRNVRTLPVLLYGQPFDPYNYGPWWNWVLQGDIYQIRHHAGGGGATDAEYYYEDEDFPFKPTTIIEYFDDDGDGQYDRPSRKTTMKYDEYRGNLIEQRVYVDSEDYVYTEYDYHQDYDFPIRKTTWQGYCYDEGETVITSGAKVEEKWLYGDVDGNPIEGGTSGDYLVQESILLDETSPELWSDTFYTYEPEGQVKSKEDPEGIITYYEYDGYGFKSKEWQGASLVGGSPTGNPQTRFYYDGLGRKILEADYLGKVEMNVCDYIGQIKETRKYKDADAMVRPDDGVDGFRPQFYDNDIPNDNEFDWWENRTLHSHHDPYNQPWEVILPTGATIWRKLVHGGQTFLQRFPLDPYAPYEDNRYAIIGDGRIAYERRHFYWDGTDLVRVYNSYVYDSMFRLLHKYSEFPKCKDPYNYKVYIKHEEYQYDASGNKIYEAVYRTEQNQGGTFEPRVLEKSNSYEYDILGRLTKKVVDSTDGGLNQTTEYGYDAAGNRIYVIDPNGNVIFTDFDNANRKLCEYFAVEPVYVPGTDEIDFAETKATAVVRKEVDYYNNNKTKDANSYDYDGSLLACTEYIYDSRGRIEQVRELIEDIDDNSQMDPTDDIATTSYEYSDDGSLQVQGESGYHIVIQDAEDKKTGIKLSYHGKIKIITYPSGDYEEYSYYSRPLQFDPDGSYADPYIYFNGLLEQKTVWENSAPKHITYRYDDYGKVQTKIYGEGDPSDPYLEYAYTSRFLGEYGKVKTITDKRNDNDRPGADGSTFTFDYWYLFEKVKSYEDYEGYTVHYDYLRAYDRQSEVKITDPYDAVIYHVTNSYDLAGRLIDVREPLLGSDDLIADLDYDNNGNRDILTYSLNGKEILDISVSVDYSYNLDNLLTGYNTTSDGVTGPTFTLDDVVVDGLGRLVSAGETITEVDNVGTISYLLNNFTNPDDYPYDMRSQLIKARVERTTAPPSNWNWEADYTYRKDGNLDTRQETDMSQPAAFEYDFDNNGSDDGDIMTAATGGENFTLGWDWNGNMTSTDMTAGDDTTLEYNWDNKLRSGTKGADSIALKYDPMGNRIFKDSSEAGQRKYIVDIAGNLPVILMELDSADNMDIMKKYIYADGQVLAQHDIDDDALPAKDDMYFYLHDRLGSVRQMVDTAGDVVRLYTYKPFGETLEAEEKTAAPSNVFMFTGQYFDSEIDEYYLRARMYDPHIGRFTSRDPVRGKFKEPLTLHVYLYCLNDPVNRIDPEGRFSSLSRSFANAILTGYALYFHGIDLATYAVASDNWKFWDLSRLTFEFMPMGMGIAAITPAPEISRLYFAYYVLANAETSIIEEGLHRTGMSYPESLTMDPLAFLAYSTAMWIGESYYGITYDEMEDFARWHGRLWGDMWK